MITIAILLALCGQPPASAGTGPDVRCGSFCLFVALQALGKAPADHAQLEDVLGLPGLQGYSLQQLKDAAERFGARTLAVETSLDNLRHRMRGESFTCLTLIDSDHFVLVKDLDSTRIAIIDPPRSFQVSVDTFSASWSGKALLIAAGELRSEESVGRGRLAREFLPWLAIGGGGVLALTALTVAVRRGALRVEKGAKALIAAICIAALEAVGGCSPADHEAPVRNGLTISDEDKDLGAILHQLEPDVEAPDAPGPWRATVRIRTDHEKSGEVSVPISGVVSPEGVGA